jgi:predicted AlkP superfamily phosphohydrolase/phosphomutase/tetratricopeptide (TPR) repeat protein
MKNEKVLLIGWDAADWKILNPLIDQGLMPNLEKLINGGTISNFATLDPPYSPMLWTSMSTGKRPYKHGVHGFIELTPDRKKVRPVMSISRKTKAIWNMLSEHGKKTHVVGWWPSHPAEKINGTMISNFYQNHVGGLHQPWPISNGTVFPEEKQNWFAQFRVHPHELNQTLLEQFVPNIKSIDVSKEPRIMAIAKITAHATSLHAAFTNIIRTEEWDFAALYLDAIDHYCHGFMRFHPPKRPHITQEEFDNYNYVVTAGYRYHDMMLGTIMNYADDNTNIILVSDHGFQPDHLRPRDIPKEPAGPAYEHSPYGIIVAKGPGIKKDKITFGASVLDLTPTILHLMGYPVGEDMDGRVLTNILNDPAEIEFIKSWDTNENPFEKIQVEADLTEEEANSVLDQLEDLGYIEKQTGDLEKRLKQTEEECNYNLARSYIDGGLIENAIEILEKLHRKNIGTPRYAFRLAICYQVMGKFAEAREIINLMKDRELYDRATLDTMDATLLIAEKQPVKALQLLKGIEGKVNKFHARTNLQMAQCYLMLKRYPDAKEHLMKELELDYDNEKAHYLLGNINLRAKYFEEAADNYLTAVGLNFNEPQYHANLGKAFFNLGKYEEAAKAWENSISMFPNQFRIRERLQSVYQYKLNETEKAEVHADWLNNIQRPTIYIVSGLPRSGTSMMMQMLEKGGMEIFTDKKREADENNPKGYYEHEMIKNLAKNNRILNTASGKVVKVIAHLLKHLPDNFEYKIIFMERSLEEVMFSQDKMLVRLGKKKSAETLNLKIMDQYTEQLKRFKDWISTHSNYKAIYVNYREVIENPFEQALRINEFLDYTLMPELMAKVVEKSLYREKK